MSTYIGVGIYSVPEASRLTGVSYRRIRYWLKGYAYQFEGAERRFPPKCEHQLPIVDDRLALGFRDLMEVRFVDAFRKYGVSWRTINRAADKARKLFGKNHPFSTKRFKTDGCSIFAEVIEQEGEVRLIDVVADQNCFRAILQPYLYEGVEFDKEDNPNRWYPPGLGRRVVIDPARSFGQPIVAREGVPTSILVRAYESCRSFHDVAQWYEISRSSVQAAVTFERRLMAA